MKKEKAFSRRYCFFENAKNLGQSDNGKQRKKGISLKGENVNLIKNGQGLIPRTIKVLKGTARYCTSPNVHLCHGLCNLYISSRNRNPADDQSMESKFH